MHFIPIIVGAALAAAQEVDSAAINRIIQARSIWRASRR
jgi:hypothetical protein